MTSRSLIGTELDQVPVNGMLGGLAYQSSENATIKNLNLKNLADIDTDLNDTAVDVFVYDTSKDSDGGAWRKRTQSTSWYNETLNTSTRGSRKEFPAVAVIVAETTKVTIYDGDDPDLPMWMVFTWSGSVDNLLGYSNRAKSAITAVNGYLITCSDPDGIHIARFIHDDGIRYTHVNHVYTSDSIANRTNTTYRTINTSSLLIASTCNDIAATVLPNAPIDPSTGLPTPTIAVATQQGVSVITDSGTVYDLTPESQPSYSAIKNFMQVDFTKENHIVLTDRQTSSGYSNIIYLPFYNYNQDLTATYSALPDSFNYTWDSPIRNVSTEVGEWKPQNNNEEWDYLTTCSDSFVVANSDAASGIGGIVKIGTYPNQLMVNRIAKDYNTGWAYGLTQGIFLSDTDTTNVSELVTNGTFDTNTNGWVSEQSATLSVDNGRLKVLTTNTSYGSANQTVTGLEVGKKYSFSVDMIHSGVSAASMVTVLSGATPQIISGWQSADYRWETSFTATGTSLLIDLQMASISNVYGLWDNVKLHLAEEDRSVKNNPLQVLGTITKTPVATGAELVGYSGFSNSNYIKQSYTSDMDFGTGNFSVTWWQYITGDISNSEYVYDRQGSSGNRHAIYYTSGNNGSISLYTNAGATSEMYAENINQYKDQWACYTATRDASSGDLAIYINGKLGYKAAGMVVRNLTNSSAELFIGIRHSVNIGAATQAKFALMRFSSSIPSPEQIKKMYEDEKCLFHGNAKATLYGSSDAVTALAYDDITSLLHVGTSGGRSTFSGLKRVENTTTAVATAISASNGLVAEQ